MEKETYFRSSGEPNGSSGVFVDYYGSKYISICRKVRELAIRGKLIIEEDSGNAAAVNHFIKLINSCGVSIRDFIRGYFSVIQPYLFEGFQRGSSEDESVVWNIDIGYMVRLMLNLHEDVDGDYLVVSLHEGIQSEPGGVTRLSKASAENDFSGKLCAVIVDRVCGWSEADGFERNYRISFTSQSSFIRSTTEMMAQHINKGIALVKYSKVEDLYQDKINTVLNDLQETYYVGSEEQVLSLKGSKVSFLGYKYSVANNICLLLDCFATYTDSCSRSVVLEVANDLLSEIPIESAPELRAALEDKYGRIIGYDNELYQQILLCIGEG